MTLLYRNVRVNYLAKVLDGGYTKVQQQTKEGERKLLAYDGNLYSNLLTIEYILPSYAQAKKMRRIKLLSNNKRETQKRAILR